MKFESPFTNVCNELEQAALDGYQLCQSLAAYITCGSFMRALPNARVVYDGRQCGNSSVRPNIFIWEDGATPALQIIGNLRCEPHSADDIQEQVKSVENFSAMQTVSVLDRDPASLEYCERHMKVSPRPELALILIHDQIVNIRYWSTSQELNRV